MTHTALPYALKPLLRIPSSILLAACLIAPALRAQPSLTVRGSVVSAVDGSPLANVVVQVLGEPQTSARTGSSGAFALHVQTLPVRIAGVRIGYAPDTAFVAPPGDILLRLRPTPVLLTPAVIAVERSFSVASSSTIRALDIQLRPRGSSQELLRLAPGLVIAQHAGGGKAEQLYLRGFDADHGTDVAISVDGIPVNMVSHAHGQGYADLHWLMPEVVAGADVRKGPFDARDGDFATGGSVSFRTRDRIGPGASRSTSVGAFGTRQAVAMAPFGGDASSAGGYVAGSMHLSDGPFLSPQDSRRFNAFARATVPLGSAELVALGSAFTADWNASGQVPDRAVRSGLISRFGAIDNSEGGSTSRYDASVSLRSRHTGMSSWEVTTFATRYDFDLFSNFTFFLADSVNRDGIEQVDDRTMLGAFGSWTTPASLLRRDGLLTVGAGTRADMGDVALWNQRERDRLTTRTDVRLRQNHLYQWLRYQVAVAPRLRADLAMRSDLFRFATMERNGTEEVRWKGIVSPRVNLAFDARAGTTLFASAGTGFHSNDARDVILADRSDRVLSRAVSAELGSRHSWTGGTLAVAAWWLDLQSETVFVGDEGTTEASGRTRRVGVDLEFRQQLAQHVWFDADLNLANGRFRDAPRDANRIPLAPTRTTTAGLTARNIGLVEGGVRVRHIGSRAANEDNSVRALGYSVWEMFGTWRLGPSRVLATIDNLFNVRWNEAQSRRHHDFAEKSAA